MQVMEAFLKHLNWNTTAGQMDLRRCARRTLSDVDDILGLACRFRHRRKFVVAGFQATGTGPESVCS